MQRRGVPWVFAAIAACLASCEGTPSVLNPRPEDPSGTGALEPDDNVGFSPGPSSPTSTSGAEDPVLAPPIVDMSGRVTDAGIPMTDAADAASGDAGADSDATAPDAQ